jgi:hypothetical protein
VGDDADRLLVSMPQDVATIQRLKDTAGGFHGGIGGLIQKTPHLTISLWRSMAVADACALVITGTGTDPRREVARGGKARGGHADLGHDLLRRIDAQSGHFCQPLDLVVVWGQQVSQFLVEFINVSFKEL